MMSAANPLRYRRQFVLGPHRLPDYEPWPSAEVGAGLVVSAQRDLPLVQLDRSGLRLTLLGFILDPTQPELDDLGVLTDLAQRSENARQVPERAAELTGRFVLIADDGQNTLLFHDPCGLREVFCTTAEADGMWCASQPCRVADPMRYEVDAAAETFMESEYFRTHHEPWWPGDSTPYAEMRRLPPNHFVDLRTREVQRFWPTQVLRPSDPEDAAQIAAQLLRGSIQAASRRFPLALPLTSGMDSRMVLAATRGQEDIFHYTLHHAGIERSAPDLTIPRRLLRRLGREHHVIECPDRMSDEFASIYRGNVTCTHASAGAMAESLLERYPAGRVMLSGHCSEIARDTFRVTHRPAPDADILAHLMGMRGDPTALNAFDNWLARNQPVAEATGFRLWDLFFWEQETGTWAANGQSQWDMVHERFTPFNQRGVLRTLLSTDPFFRQAPRYELPRRIIQILWPELLELPFNPADQSVQTRMNSVVQKLQNRSGVLRVVSESMAAFLALRYLT